RAACAGDQPRLPPLPIRYVDYAAWQDQRIAEGGFADDEQYWIAQLAGDLPVMDLPAPDDVAAAGPAVYTRTFVLEPAAVQGLQRLTTDGELTSFMLRLALLEASLARVTGADDQLVGAPVAGRERPELQTLVGFFVNLLAFRTALAGDPSFEEVVRRVRQTCLDAYAHQDYPFDELVQRLNPVRQAGRVPVFDAMFTTFGAGAPRAVEGLTIGEVTPRDGAMLVWPGASMAVALFVTCREERDGALAWVLS